MARSLRSSKRRTSRRRWPELKQAVTPRHDAHTAAERAHHDAQRNARQRGARQQPAGEPPADSATGEPGAAAVVDEDLDELDGAGSSVSRAPGARP